MAIVSRVPFPKSPVRVGLRLRLRLEHGDGVRDTEEGRLRMGIGLGVRLQAGGEGKAAFAPGFNGLERPALEDSFFTGLLGLFSSPRPIYYSLHVGLAAPQHQG